MADNMNVTVRDPLAPRRQMPPIVIGRAGEYGATTVTFDLRGFVDRYGAGVPTLLHKRPPDDEAYIVPLSAADTETHDRTEMPDSETLVWHVGQVATSYVGNGKIELQWHPEGAAKKSAQFDVVVLGTIGNPVSEIPDAQQIYLDVMQGIADDAEDAADRAEAAVEHYPKIVNGVWHVWSVQDEDYVSTGIEAQGEEGYSPTVTITAIDGGHRVTITDADGAHTFDVMDGEGGSGGGAVESVNGKTGVVVLGASDVGALPDTYVAPVQSVNGMTGPVTLGAADVGALPDSTVIPPTVTEQTVAGWGFTKNTGTYVKPSTGIPASDLASGVQTSLGKADTALQSHQSLAAYRTATAQDTIDAAQDQAISGKLSTTGNAYRTTSIPMGHLDATSTATVMTATVDGITELRDGVCMWLRNGVITSASGFTINVNGLGAKPCYSSLAAESRSTTIFNVNYTMLFVYNSTRVDGGCWDIVYGVDTNTTYTPVKLGFGYTTCSTAEATTAKTASLSSYTLTANGIVSVKFTNAVPANSTLNIASKGAKAMYYRGNPITAGVIKAGDTATFVYSTYYHLIAIDRDEAGDALPSVTASDNGKFLRVVNGAWAAETVSSYQGGSY